MVVNEDRAVVHALARQQLAFYPNVPYFRNTWALAGNDPNEGYSERLRADLLVYGSEADVVADLRYQSAL